VSTLLDLMARSPPLYAPDFLEPWQDADEPYRYALAYPVHLPTASRPALGLGGTVLWVMFNPSAATALELDNTIRKVREFSRRWGFGRFLVGNLFARRGTDPRELVALAKAGEDIIGARNDACLLRMAGMADRIVVAWGGLGSLSKALRARERQAAVLDMLQRHGDVYALSINNDGSPAHPLFMAYETPLETFARKHP
jgi:hypothetical protein